MLFEWIFASLLGAVMGSFLNVLVIRIREGASVWGRSRCVHCQHELKARHLVPILSWVWLGGRCGFCEKRIHIQYPLVELASALVFCLVYARQPFFQRPEVWLGFLFESMFLWSFLGLAVFDLRWKLLPVEPMVFLAGLAALLNIYVFGVPWSSVLVGIMVGGVFLGAQFWWSRGRWMGGGDPWLGVLMGAFLGWPGVGFALYLAYVIGGILVALLWALRIVHRGTRLPFAPFLVGGTLGALVFGRALDHWARLILGF